MTNKQHRAYFAFFIECLVIENISPVLFVSRDIDRRKVLVCSQHEGVSICSLKKLVLEVASIRKVETSNGIGETPTSRAYQSSAPGVVCQLSHCLAEISAIRFCGKFHVIRMSKLIAHEIQISLGPRGSIQCRLADCFQDKFKRMAFTLPLHQVPWRPILLILSFDTVFSHGSFSHVNHLQVEATA